MLLVWTISMSLGQAASGPTRGFWSSSGPEARSALTRVAACLREREPSALAGRRGPSRQQAQRRLPKARQGRAAGTADHNAGLSRAWKMRTFGE
jgi:hypothetical protein